MTRAPRRGDAAPRRRSRRGLRPSGEYAAEWREEILGELLGMVEAWKAAQMPLADVRFRNPAWARNVGGMLQVAGIDGFLINKQKKDQATDPRRVALFEFGMRHEGQRLPVGGWIDVAEEEGIPLSTIGVVTETSSRKATESALGRLMSDYTNMEEIIGDRAVTLRADETGHARGKTYVFETEERGRPSTSTSDFVEMAQETAAQLHA